MISVRHFYHRVCDPSTNLTRLDVRVSAASNHDIEQVVRERKLQSTGRRAGDRPLRKGTIAPAGC